MGFDTNSFGSKCIFQCRISFLIQLTAF